MAANLPPRKIVAPLKFYGTYDATMIEVSHATEARIVEIASIKIKMAGMTGLVQHL